MNWEKFLEKSIHAIRMHTESHNMTDPKIHSVEWGEFHKVGSNTLGNVQKPREHNKNLVLETPLKYHEKLFALQWEGRKETFWYQNTLQNWMECMETCISVTQLDVSSHGPVIYETTWWHCIMERTEWRPNILLAIPKRITENINIIKENIFTNTLRFLNIVSFFQISRELRNLCLKHDFPKY